MTRLLIRVKPSIRIVHPTPTPKALGAKCFYTHSIYRGLFQLFSLLQKYVGLTD